MNLWWFFSVYFFNAWWMLSQHSAYTQPTISQHTANTLADTSAGHKSSSFAYIMFSTFSWVMSIWHVRREMHIIYCIQCIIVLQLKFWVPQRNWKCVICSWLYYQLMSFGQDNNFEFDCIWGKFSINRDNELTINSGNFKSNISLLKKNGKFKALAYGSRWFRHKNIF